MIFDDVLAAVAYAENIICATTKSAAWKMENIC